MCVAATIVFAAPIRIYGLQLPEPVFAMVPAFACFLPVVLDQQFVEIRPDERIAYPSRRIPIDRLVEQPPVGRIVVRNDNFPLASAYTPKVSNDPVAQPG